MSFKLLPHQQHLDSCCDEMKFPFFIFWGMGSGKTIGGCVCMQHLKKNNKVLVVCDKSLICQWEREIKRMRDNAYLSFPENLQIQVIHYEGLDKEEAPNPKEFHMCIVDEVHRFRNAWHTESKRMLSWMTRLHKCPKLILMSGTPLVHDVDIELNAFYQIMKGDDIRHRIHYYNPREDTKQLKYYAQILETIMYCPMSWAQCFKYLLHKKQTFSLHLEGEEDARRRLSSSRNTYNTLLRSISNNPFPERPGWSPKFRQVIETMKSFKETSTLRQVVYSSRRDSGITALKFLWLQTSKSSDTFEVNGSMTDEERDFQVLSLGKSPRGVIFITDAGGQGIDFKQIGAMHIVEPSENLQEERQVINRAVRFKAHRTKDPVVKVFLYIITFPKSLKVEEPWKAEIFKSGMFEKNELVGLTEKMQNALKYLIDTEEKNVTIDESIVILRQKRDDKIQETLRFLMGNALLPPAPKNRRSMIKKDVNLLHPQSSEDEADE